MDDGLQVIGAVDAAGNAVVTVRVGEARGAYTEIDCIVDTGFNDWLTLPRSQIESLDLSFREEGRYTLADGSETISRLYAGEIEWFGQWRRILVAEMDGGPLLGMAMLRGYYLGIEVIDAGLVVIEGIDE